MVDDIDSPQLARADSRGCQLIGYFSFSVACETFSNLRALV